MVELEGFETGDPVAELYERHLMSSSADSKHVTAVLEAVASILKAEGIKPSPTAVFAASLSSLERTDTEASPETSAAMLTVLGVALEHAPTGPVLSRLPHAMQVLLKTGRAAQEKPVALKGVVRCIGQLVAALRDAQDPGTNEWPHCAKAFGAISNLCVDSRPKVRKQAAASVAEALRAVRGTSAAGPASRAFATVAVAIARAPVKAARELTNMHGASGAKAAEQRAQAAAQESLHLLVALKLILGELDGSSAGEVSGAVTGLLDLAEPLLTQHACDALVALFQPTGASATAAAAAAAAAAAGNTGFGVPGKSAIGAAVGASSEAAATAAAAIGPLSTAAQNESTRRPTLAVSLIRAHAAAVRRLHELDPADAGARALPLACHELVKMLNAVHEGVVMEAATCLASLVTKCVDTNMVREGIKAMAAARAAGKSAPARPPPVIGVAAALKASLGFRYRAAWPVALPVVAVAFERLGAAAGAILGGCLEALGEMGAHAEGLACRGQLTQTLSAAVKALGPEQVLGVLPLRLEEGIDAEIAAKSEYGHDVDDGMGDDDMDMDIGAGAELNEDGGNVAGAAGARLWLVPLLRQALKGARMSYFSEEILPVARRLGARAAQAKAAGRAFEAQRCAAGEAALWSLLPAFCRWPQDASESFPGLAPSLGSALSARADLRGPLTEALRRLIQQARAVVNADKADADSDKDDEDEDDEDDEDKAKEAAATALLLEDRPDWFSAQIAEGQAATVAKYARNFLPILFNLFVAAPPERRGELSATVGCFAQITETAALGGFFRTVLRKLVKVTSDAEDAPDALQEGGDTKSARRCTFMDLSLAMVPGLDNAARDLVFKAARPAALEKDAAVQKRAYKLLAALMKPALGPGANLGGDWLVANAEPAEEALVEGSGMCAPAARRYRLRCVAAILPSLMEREAEKDDAEDGAAMGGSQGSFAVLLGELIVATKETNARTRQQAFRLLVDIPRSMERKAGRAGGSGRIGGGAGGGGGMLGAWLAEGSDDENDAPDAANSDDEFDGMDAVDGEEMGAGVRKFFMTVLAGVVGATPTMQSATVMALARLLYEFSAALVSTVPELLPAVFALMETGNREVIKGAIGFIKVAAVRLPQTDLAAQLPTLVPALLHCCDDEDGFNRFRSKVRVVVERLVKRCGWDAVEAVTPELHSALLQHMRREEVRTERRRKASVAGSEFGGGAKSLAGKSARTARKSAWNDEEVFSDDDGQTVRTGRGGRSTVGGGGRGAYSMAPTSRRDAGGGGPRSAAAAHALRAVGGARLPGAASGSEPLNLLDESAMRRHMLNQSRGGEFDDDDGGGYKRDEGGRLVIVEEKEGRKRGRDDEDDFDDGRSVGGKSLGGVSRRTAKTMGGFTMRSGRSVRTNKTSRTTKSGATTKTVKSKKGDGKHSTDRYKAKKGAQGDRMNGALEPYAYWQLDPRMLNRRPSKRAKAGAGLAKVVRNTGQIGIMTGQKAKDAKQRKKY
jgi:ribosomal RNA-processing protein 12|mmetsp:Transcript_3369/g.15587  ORF Transcript_3369/g.15587 Transcript_3369/m.15587 type:complete len:1484 (-) Transcript_3369:93-4544(-)